MAHSLVVQGPRQGLAAVGPDLDLEGEPGLDPHVAEAQLGVDAVVAQ